MKDATMPDVIYVHRTCGGKQFNGFRKEDDFQDVTISGTKYIRADLATQQPEGEAGDTMEAFEKYFKGYGLDFTKSKDAWGKEIYKHTHIDSMWAGWQAAKSPTPSLESAVKGLQEADRKLDCFDIKASEMNIGKPCLIVAEVHELVRQVLESLTGKRAG